ncbi:hypothetical protein [Coleofasciculus sp. FACHB-1120]|uniref:hypothetical protein n=1 Tax=Coleofasciculus sp. FACHB-1120 TaxID=2692783 RepID=UPI0016884F5E|nr:hypothetical protein [Coleofasciculus sp. FACHB-1120]MBD2740997.1 hypothetical protein [Coleofasciculus sp. FACHB-1120]
MRLTNLMSVLVLSAASTVIASSAIAQQTSIPDLFNRAITEKSKDFFGNESTRRDIDFIIGPSFPENEIEQDAKTLDNLYRELLWQQVSSDFIIRTPDLPNPFNTSILQSPAINVNVTGTGRPLTGSEFVFENPPQP